MLALENVTISYKTKKGMVPVIKNLSLQIGQGRALAILGPSGCGKSTLINALAGIISIDGGTVDFIQGGLKQSLNAKVHKIGIIPQDCGLLPWKTVKANCMLPLKIRGENIDENRKKEIAGIYDS